MPSVVIFPVERVRSWRLDLKWGIVGLICIAVMSFVITLGPIPQSQSYHQFADSRRFLALPNALNVLSNLPFVVVGLLGLLFTLHPRLRLEKSEHWAYVALFAGLLLTGFGSGYYHLAPNNQTLVFDRIPMTIAMAGFLTALTCDRFGPSPFLILPGLLFIGIVSVIQWSVSEEQGHGDLRWYALYQGLIIIMGTAILILFPSRRSSAPPFAIAVIGNIAAKVFELLDRPIYQAGGLLGGHTLKHLSAGLSFVPLVLFVYHRSGRETFEAARGKSA